MCTNPTVLFLLAREHNQELDRAARRSRRRAPRARRRRAGHPPGE